MPYQYRHGFLSHEKTPHQVAFPILPLQFGNVGKCSGSIEGTGPRPGHGRNILAVDVGVEQVAAAADIGNGRMAVHTFNVSFTAAGA